MTSNLFVRKKGEKENRNENFGQKDFKKSGQNKSVFRPIKTQIDKIVFCPGELSVLFEFFKSDLRRLIFSTF